MEDQYRSVCNTVEQSLRNSCDNKRYRAVDVFKKVMSAAIGAGVPYFPLKSSRIINIGIRDKYFVLRYNGEVRTMPMLQQSAVAAPASSYMSAAGSVYGRGSQAHDLPS